MESKDGHVRQTNGENYALHSGDANTHARMQAKAEEFMQCVRDRGLNMESISRGECKEILLQIGMRMEDDQRF